MSKQSITKKQKRALQLCHHDFEGLTQKEAAKKMKISQQAISKLLILVKKALPQYFPILTKQEERIYHYYMVEGWSVETIAKYTKLSCDTIYNTLQRGKSKKKSFTGAVGRILSYDEFKEEKGGSIDIFIKQKF